MSTVNEIEEAIQKLPEEDFFQLREWIQSRFEDCWDTQIESDAEDGRLKFLAESAIAEYRSGKTYPFPSDE